MKTLAFTKTNPMGGYNGYVVFEKQSKIADLGYDDLEVDIHGGLTFGENVNGLRKEWDEIPSEFEGGVVFGFDTCHYNDTPAKWPQDKVLKEAQYLETQLIEIEKNIIVMDKQQISDKLGIDKKFLVIRNY